TQDIEKTISLIPKLIQALPEDLLKHNIFTPKPNNVPDSNHLEKYTSSNNIKLSNSMNPPEIHIDRGDSLTEIIVKLFVQLWGSKPRKLGEIREVLQSYGQVYPKQSVAVALLRLAQSGRLRRFKGESGEYVYTASTTLAPESPRRATLPTI
ncbi:hypothetical protein ACFL96_20520, partial [Thermoproteota archaeon]